jgi:protein SCO1/2
VTLAGLLQAIAAQDLRPGRDFATLAFGIDPKETPKDAAASLERLLREFPAFPGGSMHALTGSTADIAAVTDALGYRYAWDAQLGQFDHIAAVAVLTPQGRLARWLYGVTPEPKDLKLALTEAGQGRIGTWADQLLLFCYHYDPATGRYSSVIWVVLRILAGATVVALLALIGRSVLRERRLVRERRP